MKKTILLALVTALLLSGCGNSYKKKKEGKEIKTSEFSISLDKSFKTADTKKSPGYGIFLMEDSKVTHSAGYGIGDFEKENPILPDSVFYHYGIYMDSVIIGLMKLIEDGKLGFDDPIVKYLPELKENYSSKTTIRMLLSATSGFPDFWDYAKERETWTFNDILELYAGLNGEIFKPGTKCTWNTFPAVPFSGIIIERITGKSLNDYLNEEIFERLGMKNTVITDDPEYYTDNMVFPTKRTVNGYKRAAVLSEKGQVYPLSYTNMNDIALWYTALDTGKMLNKDMMEEYYSLVKLTDGTEIFNTSNSYYSVGWTISGYYSIMKDRSYSGYSTDVESSTKSTTLLMLEKNIRVFIFSQRKDAAPGDKIFMDLTGLFLNQ